MKVDTLKDLEGLLKTCRKHGVRAVKIDGIEFTLENDLPTKPMKVANSTQPSSASLITGEDRIETPDFPTLEQLIDYSSVTGPS